MQRLGRDDVQIENGRLKGCGTCYRSRKPRGVPIQVLPLGLAGTAAHGLNTMNLRIERGGKAGGQAQRQRTDGRNDHCAAPSTSISPAVLGEPHFPVHSGHTDDHFITSGRLHGVTIGPLCRETMGGTMRIPRYGADGSVVGTAAERPFAKIAVPLHLTGSYTGSTWKPRAGRRRQPIQPSLDDEQVKAPGTVPRRGSPPAYSGSMSCCARGQRLKLR